MKLIPWQLRDYIRFYKIYGKAPNISNPKTLNEKILYRKKHQSQNPLFTLLADKYLVRQYVEDKIGSEYLINLVDVVDSMDVGKVILNIDDYKGCVIKPNHASGRVYIVPSEVSEQDLAKLEKTMKKWMSTDYSKRHGEMQYRDIERKILIEEFIGDRDTLPIDYKIHLFKKSYAEYNYVIEVLTNRAENEMRSTFFVNNLEDAYLGHYEINKHEKEILIEAINLSKTLLDDLDYARIDWYIIKEQLLFGEITLTPFAGLDKNLKGDLDSIMGNFWNLSLYKA